MSSGRGAVYWEFERRYGKQAAHDVKNAIRIHWGLPTYRQAWLAARDAWLSKRDGPAK